MAKGVQLWERSAKLDPRLGAPLNNLGIHLCHDGQYEKGLKYLESAIELDSEHPDYLYNLAQAYLLNPQKVEDHYGWRRKKIYREAMKASKKAASLAPDDFDLAQDYAVNFYAAENDPLATDVLVANGYQIADGLATVPDSPGFGLALNEQAFRSQVRIRFDLKAN